MTMSNSAEGLNEDKPLISGSNNHVVRRVVKVTLLFMGIAVLAFVIHNNANPFASFLRTSYYFHPPISAASLLSSSSSKVGDLMLDGVLKNASMKDRTVILTTLNDAWAEPNSVLDLFLHSFRIGNQTQWLLNHLVIICLDDKAYARCLASHPHCYDLRSRGDNFTNEAFFMTANYLKMMWTRIDLLASILQMGYNFVFTDADVMWFRDPFQRFHSNADFQIACDRYLGNPDDVNNLPNGGFTYVISNNRTIPFYKFWYKSREYYKGMHDQDVLNEIKSDPFIKKIGIRMKFLDTAYFGGFCEPSKDLNLVCTMHANCCVGQPNKVHDLKILLEDWIKFTSLPATTKASSPSSWRVPDYCRTSFDHHK
ncbi:hypothetical protein RGQ29_003272 [Quercus rubra]|uniref:Nucleotide-diphospho-sugar transferase domain-containing protein n=1 Tax=Quercus rubra TaxID=3512 RepID=A0AAN7EBH9_QUERU|nr:hypothetical protein RGQ29_003272 [Quercus rubra]